MYSMKIDNWDVYNVDNALRFQYEPNRSHYDLRTTPEIVKLGEVTSIDANIFELDFDKTLFTEVFQYYGIKQIYSDKPIQVKLKYSSNISWDLSQNPYTIIPINELETGLTIYLYYDNKPDTILFNMYPIVNSGSSSLVESVEFGVKLI